MLIRIFTGLTLLSTAMTVLLTPLINRGADLVWLIPLLLIAIYAAWNIIYVLLLFIWTQLFVKLDKPQKKPSRFARWHLDRLAETICVYFGIKLHISGEELIPTDRRFLLVCNHRSFFDPVVKVAAFVKYGIIYISKPSNFRVFVGGRLMHLSGCLALDRDNNRQALGVIKRAIEIIEDDIGSICIYPEGTRSRTGELGEFHAGSFKIAQKAGAPVVVAVVQGTENVMKNCLRRRTDVSLDIVGIIDADTARNSPTSVTAAKARELVESKLRSDRKGE